MEEVGFILSVLVSATNIDVIADVFNTRNTIDGVTHFLLEDFPRTRETKGQPLAAKQPGGGSRGGARAPRAPLFWEKNEEMHSHILFLFRGVISWA